MNKVYCVLRLLFLTILVMSLTPSPAAARTPYWVYIGTSTHSPSKSKGIYLYRLDTASGAIDDLGLAAELGDPGWQKTTADGKFLYTVGTAANPRTSIVAAYSIDGKTGKLTFLNQQATKGEDSTHVDVDPGRTCAVVANYNSGDISVMPIESDGKIGAPTAVINFDPSGKYVLAPDLGVDKIYVYRFDAATRSLSDGDPATVAVTPGSGPRHLTFDPSGKFAYLVTEMGGTVVAYSWDANKGQLHFLQTVSTLPADFLGYNKSAEVRILPNGKFLYASNRGPDTLAIFAREESKGTLKLTGFESTKGRGPRDFAIDPTGQFLFAANQDTDNVEVFRIDQETGALTPMNDLKVPTPICVTFLAVQK
jgi:6-phosphogluconolactonase